MGRIRHPKPGKYEVGQRGRSGQIILLLSLLAITAGALLAVGRSGCFGHRADSQHSNPVDQGDPIVWFGRRKALLATTVFHFKLVMVCSPLLAARFGGLLPACPDSACPIPALFPLMCRGWHHQMAPSSVTLCLPSPPVSNSSLARISIFDSPGRPDYATSANNTKCRPTMAGPYAARLPGAEG